MANPRHGGRGSSVNGRGGGTLVPRRDGEPSSDHRTNGIQESRIPSEDIPNYRGRGASHGRGGAVRGGNVLGGRGGFAGGRGIVPPPGGGGFRGRGRGQGTLWSSS